MLSTGKMATHSTPISLPGEFHGQRSLVGYSPWGCKELDMTEWLTHTHTQTHSHPQIQHSRPPLWFISIHFKKPVFSEKYYVRVSGCVREPLSLRGRKTDQQVKMTAQHSKFYDRRQKLANKSPEVACVCGHILASPGELLTAHTPTKYIRSCMGGTQPSVLYKDLQVIPTHSQVCKTIA